MNPEADKLLRRLRWMLGAFVVGLVLSGVTAFPLERELDLLVKLRGLDGGSHLASTSGLDHWILTVRDGLHDAYGRYPWLAYGTDWLAFAHLVIAVFFIGVFVDPVRNVWVVQAGLIACGFVIPLALICGPLRGIPFGWRLIDCSFGVFGAIPLWMCLRWIRRLEQAQRRTWT
jgi:hypothetical protein